MAKETKTVVTWVCDRCAKSVVQQDMPSSSADAWGKLTIDQPSGFDAGGVAWAPRMREPLILCGSCIEVVVAVLNLKTAPQPAKKPVLKKNECRYVKPWVGHCKVRCSEGQEFCSEHLGEKCKCGKQATRGCDNAGSLVCGMPLCDSCHCHY